MLFFTTNDESKLIIASLFLLYVANNCDYSMYSFENNEVSNFDFYQPPHARTSIFFFVLILTSLTYCDKCMYIRKQQLILFILEIICVLTWSDAESILYKNQ